MKVSELIEKLQQMPQDVEVWVPSNDSNMHIATDVELSQALELHYRPKVGGEYKIVEHYSDLPQEVKQNIGDWILVWRDSKIKQEVRIL